MERALISVEQFDSGWQVRLGRLPMGMHDDREAALSAANELACDRHAATGFPAGVKVRMRCGTWVLTRVIEGEAEGATLRPLSFCITATP